MDDPTFEVSKSRLGCSTTFAAQPSGPFLGIAGKVCFFVRNIFWWNISPVVVLRSTETHPLQCDDGGKPYGTTAAAAAARGWNGSSNVSLGGRPYHVKTVTVFLSVDPTVAGRLLPVPDFFTQPADP